MSFAVVLIFCQDKYTKVTLLRFSLQINKSGKIFRTVAALTAVCWNVRLYGIAIARESRIDCCSIGSGRSIMLHVQLSRYVCCYVLVQNGNVEKYQSQSAVYLSIRREKTVCDLKNTWLQSGQTSDLCSAVSLDRVRRQPLPRHN